MKKYLLKITAAVLLIGTVVGCSEDKVFYDEAKGPTLAQFVSTNDSFAVFPTATKNYDSIPVQVSTISNVDRAVTVSIDQNSSSPNIADYIDIVPGSSRIPAGQYTGYAVVKYKKAYSDITFDSNLDLFLQLDAVEGASATDKTKTHTLVELYKACDYDPTLVAATTYTATVKVDPMPGFDGLDAASYEPVIKVNKNVITVNSLWGPHFLYSLTGSPSDDNQVLEPGRIVVTEVNNTLKIVPLSGNTFITGGTGTYDACKNIFKYTMTQKLFTSLPTTVTVTLTPKL